MPTSFNQVVSITRKSGINLGHDKHWLGVKVGSISYYNTLDHHLIQEKWLHTENPRLARASSPKKCLNYKKILQKYDTNPPTEI